MTGSEEQSRDVGSIAMWRAYPGLAIAATIDPGGTA